MCCLIVKVLFSVEPSSRQALSSAVSRGLVLCFALCPSVVLCRLCSGDVRTAKDSLTFLLEFFQRFPHLIENGFYIAGEVRSWLWLFRRVFCPTRTHRFNDVVGLE